MKIKYYFRRNRKSKKYASMHFMKTALFIISLHSLTFQRLHYFSTSQFSSFNLKMFFIMKFKKENREDLGWKLICQVISMCFNNFCSLLSTIDEW